MSDPYESEHPGKGLISAGLEIAGAPCSAAVGLLFAGPVGALGGAAVGPAVTLSLRAVADEIARRVLGPRECARAGAALAFGVQRLQ